jgi:cytochrome P450
MELAIALEELTRRIPDARLTPEQVFSFAPNTSFRSPTALLVEWSAPHQP